MLEILSIILTIIYVIWITRLINFGIETAKRIALASEVSAENLAILVRNTGETPLTLPTVTLQQVAAKRRRFAVCRRQDGFFGPKFTYLYENGRIKLFDALAEAENIAKQQPIEDNKVSWFATAHQ
jgi:hypothetical protein